MLDARPHIGFCLISSGILTTATSGSLPMETHFFDSLFDRVVLFHVMKVCIVPDY